MLTLCASRSLAQVAANDCFEPEAAVYPAYGPTTHRTFALTPKRTQFDWTELGSVFNSQKFDQPSEYRIVEYGTKLRSRRKRLGAFLGQRETGYIMKNFLLAFPAVALLTACDEGSTTSATSAAPNAAEQACLRDVTATTNNPDVALLGSEFSEAGTFVRVGVGPDRAPWQCIAYSDGSTDGIMSLTNEGTL